MTRVKHKFLKHKINPETEILIVGTFNPEGNDNEANFFYSRQRNYLWTLIPKAFGLESLKGKSQSEKLDFITERKIDFIDLIKEIEVDQVLNYYDGYLDKKDKTWRDVISEMENLKNLKKVCFTRKTFSDIPEMKQRIEGIKQYCERWGIKFECLVTPARFYNSDKQAEWTKFLTE